MTNKRPAVFLDRDGTLIVEHRDLGNPHLVQLEQDVVPALQLLQDAGFELIVVTNQSGIGRGHYRFLDYLMVQKRLMDLLAHYHITITTTYYCPHHPTHAKGHFRQTCHCRKPSPGMIEQGIREFDINRQRSWMVGDRLTDMGAAQSAGIPSILLLTGNGVHDAPHWPLVAPTLLVAVNQWILPSLHD